MLTFTHMYFKKRKEIQRLVIEIKLQEPLFNFNILLFNLKFCSLNTQRLIIKKPFIRKTCMCFEIPLKSWQLSIIIVNEYRNLLITFMLKASAIIIIMLYIHVSFTTWLLQQPYHNTHNYNEISVPFTAIKHTFDSFQF